MDNHLGKTHEDENLDGVNFEPNEDCMDSRFVNSERRVSKFR
jgi:hypothetical protein